MADNIAIVIPARRASTRLPDKMLAEIAGEAMVVHVWRRCVEADVGPVYVATDDAEIADTIRAGGGDCVGTSSDHASGTDRVREAVDLVDANGEYDIVVNCQGDIPTNGLSLCFRSHQMLIGLLRSRHGFRTVPGDVRELLDLRKLVSSAVRQTGGPVFGSD